MLVYTDLGNLEHGLHGLNWGPDGKLYMSKGNSKGLTKGDRLAPKPFRDLWAVPAPPGAPDFPSVRVFKKGEYQKAYHDPADDWGREGGVLRCDDLARNLEIVSRGMRNPWDITFDDGFHFLGTDNDQTGEGENDLDFGAQEEMGLGVRVATPRRCRLAVGCSTRTAGRTKSKSGANSPIGAITAACSMDSASV